MTERESSLRVKNQTKGEVIRQIMKFHKSLFLLAAFALVSSALYSRTETSKTGSSSEPTTAYLGRWDLTLTSAGHEYPSWLELSEENGQLKAEMVGRWGNARPLPSAELSSGHLKFVSPKEEEGSKADLVFEGSLKGRILTGTLNGPDGKTWQWTGRRAPSLRRTGTSKWGKPIALFNGKDLTGWHESTPGASPVWKVENGALVTPGNGPELINDSKFEDFKLHVEFNCGPESNSGVYLRGRYEVQVETDSITDPPNRRIGSIYGFIAPEPELPRTPDVWQTYDITLIGRYVTVVHDGQTVIDNKEIPGITGGALDSHEGLPGPIYLQGSEKGHVLFRSVVITPAAE
jgi:hypothetical protein